MADIFGTDAFSPAQVAERVKTVGVAKARLPLLSMIMLGLLAGAFIGLGGLFFTLVVSDSSLGFAASRVLGGVVFSLGLLLVVIAGAELFTGNNLMVMAWAEGEITRAELLRNWSLVFVANFVGAAGLAFLVVCAEHQRMNGGQVGNAYLQIAAAKCALPFGVAFFRGMLCNMLVCIAVWMAMAGRSVVDKAVAILFPITAFVAAGFEHSVANMYFIPMAIFLQEAGVFAPTSPPITWSAFIGNMVPVILGNIVGGSVLVGLTYHVIYQRNRGGKTRGKAA